MNRSACVFAVLTLLGAGAHAANPTAALNLSFTEYTGTGPVGNGTIDDDKNFYWVFESSGIWAGQAVNSWLIFWDPRSTLKANGTVTFDAPILFLQDDQSELIATAAFGKAGVTYDYSNPFIGLESTDKARTSFTSSTLTLSGIGWIAADPGDYVRVMTSAAPPVPEPGTYALLIAGLGVVGMVGRRRRPN